MTDERKRLTVDGGGSLDAESGEIDAIDPEAIAALDDEPDPDDATAENDPFADDPTLERFDEFVRDIDAGRVAPAESGDEEVPIDASMDELFAEQ